jgi:murein DD-endopeptidase MepM/ murein hydrolase activator NlpD
VSAWLKLVPAWWWVAVAGLVLAGLVGGGQQLRVAGLQGELETERASRLEEAGKLGACRETRSTLLVQVSEQNSALADLRRAELARKEAAKAAQQQARQDAEQDYKAANRLQQERTGGDACAAAEGVIDRELGL